MGRKNQTRILQIFMNSELVGSWSMGSESVFKYDLSWLKSSGKRPLSLSLPLQGTPYKGAVVDSYFDNLLPDSMEIRRRIQSRFSIGGNKAFDLLAEIGKDCVGAIQLLPKGETPQNIQRIVGIPVTEKEIESILQAQSTPRSYTQGGEEFRISLAGAQEKTAFLKHHGEWMIPQGATPTTHIFKRPLGQIAGGQIDLSGSVENEWLCSRILARFGCLVAPCEILTFGAEKILSVQRFDRKLSNDKNWIIRLPQEDFCQATGTPGALKYQSDGGPGIKDILNILSASLQSEQDRKFFFKSQILFHLMAAIDGHAKNYSISLLAGGRFKMIPLYDILSAYPVMSPATLHPSRVKMAMAVRGSSGNQYHWGKIQRRHWKQTAAYAGFSVPDCEQLIEEILDTCPLALDQVGRDIPPGFPDEIRETIFQGIMHCRDRYVLK